ncbi:uncharacterized protein Naga_100054g24 [Nannochloropsis gaditana]|uniref:Uncharacterized protein n=1 Tax=Nannochloropsis gaditana TaxID=72520 RepID=W7TZ12_9STRA|nr:uncharacterized protein Naga_100054g24 [Nannochloropsis gaditana]
MSLAPWPKRRPDGSFEASKLPIFERSATFSGRKRARSASETEQQQYDSSCPLQNDVSSEHLSDVVAAILLLIQRFYQGTSTNDSRRLKMENCPVVLQHQLYTVLDDHTSVDVELEDLKTSNHVRLFRLLTLRRDIGVLLTSTYKARVQAAFAAFAQQEGTRGRDENITESICNSVTEREEDGNDKRSRNSSVQASKLSARHMALVSDFFLKTVDRVTNIIMTQHQLESLWGEYTQSISHSQAPACPRSSMSAGPGKRRAAPSLLPSIDEVTRVLIHYGFLARRVDAVYEGPAYWFSAPELGSVTASLPRGRKAILAALARSRYKELSEQNLGALRLKGTALSLSFHMADLVGSGEVLAVPTASGMFLRLPARTASGATGR